MIHMALHETSHSGAGVPPAAGASRPRIHRGRDARAGSRDGCPTPDPIGPSSWSQCAAQTSWGLSLMNLDIGARL